MVSIKSWFPTLIYYEALQAAGGERFNRELLKECRQIQEYDQEGQEWSAENYPGGYTSYHSMSRLHQFSSTFATLEKKITRHVKVFASALEMELRGKNIRMTDCWVNIMPKGAVHSLHLHPLSFISGTYYVQAPPGCSEIKFEDPRLSKFMAAPPKKAAVSARNRQFVKYAPEAGKLILFESWLRHEVASNQVEAERISISFNYDWS